MTNSLFGPLGKQYCIIWYLLSIVCIVFLVLNVLGVFYMVFTNVKTAFSYLFSLYLIVGFSIAYIQARLLFQMCNSVL